MITTVAPPVPPEYQGREQAYIKHLFLRQYLGRLVQKISSFADHVVYVDGFSGPWNSATENYEDTSFGIALKALTDARTTWANMKSRARDVSMSAHLVETDAKAFAKLQTIGTRFPDVRIHPNNTDFMEVAGSIAAAIPARAFSFVLVDPKGFTLDMHRLRPLLLRQPGEVVFNFMFDFANRFTSLPNLQPTFDRLFVGVEWRGELDSLEENPLTTPDDRKAAFLRWIKAAIRNTGNFKYVADIEVQYPGRSRTFYYLIYGTRNSAGIEVFRECQINALEEQSAVRGRMRDNADIDTGQGLLFNTSGAMSDVRLRENMERERLDAREMLLKLLPPNGEQIAWAELWPAVLADHVVKKGALGSIANDLRKARLVSIPSWSSDRKRVPEDDYRLSRGPAFACS